MSREPSDGRAIGFRGLVALVSDIEGLEDRLHHVSQPNEEQTTRARADEAPPPARAPTVQAKSSGGPYILAFLIVIGTLIVYSLALEPPAGSRSSGSSSRPARASAPPPRVSSTARSGTRPSSPSEQTSRPRPTRFTGPFPEQIPPPGTNNILSVAQIRYCVAESIRIDAADPLVNVYSQSEVDRFNAQVNDYNARCAQYRYREGDLSQAEAEVEAFRAQIEAEGRLRFGGAP